MITAWMLSLMPPLPLLRCELQEKTEKGTRKTWKPFWFIFKFCDAFPLGAYENSIFGAAVAAVSGAMRFREMSQCVAAMCRIDNRTQIVRQETKNDDTFFLDFSIRYYI